MKKGLTLTLMTVAIAMLGFQAMAMAPVISDIPSPIIGSSTASGATAFVFPKAFDLTTYVTDPDTTSVAGLMWSFSTSASSSNYSIDGVGPIATSGATNGSAMTPGSYQINAGAKNGETLGDPTNLNLITIRNKTYAPLTGTGATPPSSNGTDGVVDSQTEELTFYASDGTTYGVSKPVYIYTEIGVLSRLSQGPVTGPTVVQPPTAVNPSSPNGLTASNLGTNNDLDTGDTAGLCFNVTLRGSNKGTASLAMYTGAVGAIPLVQNAVYRIRVTMNGSQTTPGLTPLWDLSIGDPSANLYGADLFIFDNGGSGNPNSVISSTNGTQIDFWWTPPAVATAQWNDAANGAFSTAYFASNNQSQFMYRVLDVDTNPAISAWTKSGTICMTNMGVDRWDLSTMVTGTTDWKVNSTTGNGFVLNTTAGGGNIQQLTSAGTTLSFTGGAMKITPPAGTNATSVDLFQFAPATNTTLGISYNNSAADGLAIAQQFPVAWKANTLYQVTANIGASDAASELAPPDVIFLQMLSVTNAIDYQAYVTETTTTPFTGGGPGSPRYNGGVGQTYMAFYYGQTPPTVNSSYFAQWNALQPMLSIYNTGAFTSSLNTGSITLSQFAVNEVTFPGM